VTKVQNGHVLRRRFFKRRIYWEALRVDKASNTIDESVGHPVLSVSNLSVYGFRSMSWPVELDVLAQLYAATKPSALQYKRGYLHPWARVGEPHERTKDEAEQKEIWDYCNKTLEPWPA
jgi:hypothetical protein